MEANPVIQVYGEDAAENILKAIKELAMNSNIPFDKKYVNLGITFLTIKAKEILNGERIKCGLSNLVSESFGEAAIYKYNCCDGNL